MQIRRLGSTDLELTTIGFGTYALGGGDWQWAWGSQDDADSIAALHRALELGVNWVDCAAAYGLGHSEEMLGRALAGRRQEVILATKCGLVWEPGSPNLSGRLKADSVRRECEASLRRLNTDVIDLYQIHWPNPDAEVEEGWGAMADLVREGKVRHIGVSNFNVAQLERIRPIHPVASLQPPYSMVERAVEVQLLPYCAAHNIGVICYSPMQAGLLTGKVTRAWVAGLPDNDWRKDRDPHLQEPQLSANLALVDGLRPVAARSGHNVGELAIAWVLRRPEVTAAIVGARRPAQIEGTAGAGDWNLSAQDIAEVDALLAQRARALA